MLDKEGMMSHLFVSFDSEDREFADILSTTIKRETDLDTWLYTEKLPAGERWRDSIDQAIEECLALVLIMTPAAADSMYVTYEWSFADGLGRPVVPVLLKSTNLHPKLKDVYQYRDFTGTQPWDDLIDDIHAAMKRNVYKIHAPRTASSAVRLAADALSNPASKERNDALQTLREMADIEGEAVRHVLIRTVEQLTINDTRAQAAFMLAEIFKDPHAIPVLSTLLNDQNSQKREAAARALGRIGSAAAVPDLCKAVQGNQAGLRWAAAQALGYISGDDSIRCLLECLDKSDLQTRENATRSLGQLKDKQAIPGLLAVLNDQSHRGEAPYEKIREVAAWALGSIGDPNPDVIAGLTLAANSLNVMVCQAAVEALGVIGDLSGVPGLLQAFNSNADSTVRAAAALALGDLRATDAVGVLIPKLRLDTKDAKRRLGKAEFNGKRVCDCIAWALQQIGTPEALAAIEHWQWE